MHESKCAQVGAQVGKTKEGARGSWIQRRVASLGSFLFKRTQRIQAAQREQE